MQIIQTRRRFLAGAAMAGAAGVVGLPKSLHAEPPLETTTVRLPRWIGGSYCWAGVYIAGELLRAEGFTDVRYVQGDTSVDQSVVDRTRRDGFQCELRADPYRVDRCRRADQGACRAALGMPRTDRQRQHPERHGSAGQAGGRDVTMDSPSYVLVALMAAYVGLDPVNDIEWVIWTKRKPAEGFVQGKFDAFLSRRPQTQDLRAKKIGHTILNNDRRPPVVAAFLLHDFCDYGLREQIPGGDQAGPAGHRQGRRPLRV